MAAPRDMDEPRRGKIRQLTPRELQPACNKEAERNFLGALLIDAEVAPLLDAVNPGDFYYPEHQAICEAAKGVRADGDIIDLATIDEWLRARGRLSEAGGQSAVSALASNVIHTQHAENHLRIIIRLAAYRAASQAGANFVVAAAKPEASDGDSLEAHWERLRGQIETALNRVAETAVGSRDGYTAADLMKMSLPEPKWMIPNLLPLGLSLLASKQKIGKSWLALCLALAIASGGVALSHQPLDAPRDVLYLALEDTPLRMQKRIRQLLNDEPAPAQLEIWNKWPRLDRGGLRRIEQWYRKHPGGLVIIDVLQKVRAPRAKGGDIYAEDYNTMSPLKDLADQYQGAALVIHHTRKAAAEDVFDEIRDSAGLTGACDAVMVLQRVRGESMATLHQTGRDFEEEKQLALQRDKLTAGWLLLGDARDINVSDTRREIIDLLRRAKRPMTPTHIAESLGKNLSTVKNLLPRMVQDSQVVNRYNGTYGVDRIDSVDRVDRVDRVDPVYGVYADD